MSSSPRLWLIPALGGLSLSLAFTTSPDQPAWHSTQVDSVEALERLREQQLYLHWLSFPAPLALEQQGESWTLRAQASEGSEQLLLEGRLQSIDETGFTLEGRVGTQVDGIYGGQLCLREGLHRFVIHPGESAWSLEETSSPCAEVVDYLTLRSPLEGC